jgi:hypothetical protein
MNGAQLLKAHGDQGVDDRATYQVKVVTRASYSHHYRG